MKEYLLSRINLPTVCFFALCTKMVIFGADYASALALIPVAAVYGYNKLLLLKEPVKSKTLEKQIADLQNAVTSLKMGTVRKVNNDSEKIEKRYF